MRSHAAAHSTTGSSSKPRRQKSAPPRPPRPAPRSRTRRSEEHTSELQSQSNLVCRLLLEKKKQEAICTPLRRRNRLVDGNMCLHERFHRDALSIVVPTRELAYSATRDVTTLPASKCAPR